MPDHDMVSLGTMLFRHLRTGALAPLLAVLALPMFTTCAPSNPPPSSPSQPPMIFSDNFSSGKLDANKWTTCYPWFHDVGCTNEGNNEREWYLPSQVRVGDNGLQLIAERSPIIGVGSDGVPRWFPYRSGMVTTAGHFQFMYGYVEFRALAPRGRGLWPSLWLLPTSLSWPPEVDIMEAFCEDTSHVRLTYHRTPTDAPHTTAAISDISSKWHTYALDWRPDSLTWYIDGKQRFQVTQGVPQQPMYLLATLAVSGDPAHAPDYSTPQAASLDIASVRVLKH